MVKKIKNIIKDYQNRKTEVKKSKEREALVKSVERGTDVVIQQYGEALRKLAEYDRK